MIVTGTSCATITLATKFGLPRQGRPVTDVS